MFKVIATRNGEKNVHWYPTAEEAEDAAFALRSHPMFKQKTYVENIPSANIGYDTSSVS